MAGTRNSVKSNSLSGKIANFSLRERETFLSGTGLKILGNSLWSSAVTTDVAEQEILRGIRKPPEGNSPSNEMNL
jgi:hypothetical protein